MEGQSGSESWNFGNLLVRFDKSGRPGAPNQRQTLQASHWPRSEALGAPLRDRGRGRISGVGPFEPPELEVEASLQPARATMQVQRA